MHMAYLVHIRFLKILPPMYWHRLLSAKSTCTWLLCYAPKVIHFHCYFASAASQPTAWHMNSFRQEKGSSLLNPKREKTRCNAHRRRAIITCGTQAEFIQHIFVVCVCKMSCSQENSHEGNKPWQDQCHSGHEGTDGGGEISPTQPRPFIQKILVFTCRIQFNLK